MIIPRRSGCRLVAHRRGLTLVEMVVSTVLVGVGVVSALNAVGTSRIAQVKVDNRRQGLLLAQDLMTEILLQDYADPADGLDSFGLRAAETATGDRSLFDDVDDYHGWSASPPQRQDGTDLVGLDGWARSAAVAWADPADVDTAVVTNQGIKRITVTVSHHGVQTAQLLALKTIGLPPLEACCFGDGTCADLRVEACAAEDGISLGPDTICATTECATGSVALLLVVADDTNLTAQELARQALMESWEFSVEMISASASQSDFDQAVANVDVAYVSEVIVADELGTKLRDKAIGVVSEEDDLNDEFGFSSALGARPDSAVLLINNAHDYITSGFGTNGLELLSSDQTLVWVNGTLAPDLRTLGVWENEILSGRTGLAILETGDTLYGGATAAGRRVHLPWGGYEGLYSTDITALTDDGRTLMKQAIEWAAGKGIVCGDGMCHAGEECSCDADCDVPADFEQPGVTCDDGLDNDCDGVTDCDDINCPSDPACVICGNSVCESGEDCNNCSADCPSKTNGPASGQYCCGNGIAESAEGDGSICDGNY